MPTAISAPAAPISIWLRRGGGGFGGAFGGGTSSPQFVTNSYDPMQDYGRAAFDVRNRMFIGGTISLPYAFRLSPFIIADSGSPFNIIVGQDLNGDSIFNDRPALAATAGPGGKVIRHSLRHVQHRAYSWTAHHAHQLRHGPSLFSLNLRLSKTFGLGPKVEGHAAVPADRMAAAAVVMVAADWGAADSADGGGGPFIFSGETNRKYNLTFSVSARNLLNNVNYAPPIGNLDSPLFGTSNALAGAPFSSGSANRRIDLQMLFSF